MSLGRSSRFRSLGLAKVKSEKGVSSMHLHCPSLFVKVVRCVARILDADVGRTLMNMEMLKFLRARASKIIHCVVFNKVVHIVHSSMGMPFFRIRSNDRL